MNTNNRRTSPSPRSSVPPPPPEVFEIARGSIEDDDSDDSLESVASRISAWTDGAEKILTKEMTDVQLDNRKNTAANTFVDNGSDESVRSDVSPPHSVSSRSSRLSQCSRLSQSSRRSKNGPSLQDVTRVSMSMEKRNSVRNMSRQQPRQPKRHSRNVKLPYPSPRASMESSELARVTESIKERDTEAQKFDSIASKYMFDMETEDETLSTLTIRDNNKKRLMIFCYIATFAAFGFGMLVAYSMFQSGRPPAPFTESPIYTQQDDLTVQTIMPYLQKMSGEALSNNDSPQIHALQWLQNKDAYTSSSADQLVQRYILATFYYATKGSTAWDHNTNWLTPTDECTWNGITCFDEEAYPELSHLISKLSLPSYGIAGALPQEIGYLSHLRNLTLSNNDISGELPSTFVKMTNLLDIDLEKNEISGKLPDDMDQFKSLITINLQGNKLKGSIPPSIGNIATLQSINFKENSLEGIIPLELLNLNNLRVLNLAKNDLEGVIPKDIDNLNKLELLNLANNGLFGQIPDSIGNIKSLQELNLSYNRFQGEIPQSLGEIDTLKVLDLISNQFDRGASVPSEICLLELDILTVDCFDELKDNYVKCDCDFCECEA